MQEHAIKFHNFLSLVLAIAYGISLYYFAIPIPVFRYIAISFTLFLIVAAVYNYYWFRKLPQETIWSVALVLLFYISFAGLFFLAPNRFLQYLFLVFGTIAVYFQQRVAVNVGESLLSTRVILTSATLFIVISGASNFYFKLSGWIVLAVVFLLTFILSRGAYEYTPLVNPAKNINALVVGLLTTEFFWVISFLPFHYSVLGLLAFNAFYLIWQLDYSYIFHTLTTKKIIFTSLLLLFGTLIILAFTPWRVLVS